MTKHDGIVTVSNPRLYRVELVLSGPEIEELNRIMRSHAEAVDLGMFAGSFNPERNRRFDLFNRVKHATEKARQPRKISYHAALERLAMWRVDYTQVSLEQEYEMWRSLPPGQVRLSQDEKQRYRELLHAGCLGPAEEVGR